jgi:hypothetical protein
VPLQPLQKVRAMLLSLQQVDDLTASVEQTVNDESNQKVNKPNPSINSNQSS